ncbi:MAG: hypothetical protein WEB00_12925 [Dehalococcoidia bacterium]
MQEAEGLARLGLKYNPFPPASTGVAHVNDLWIPDAWQQDLRARYKDLQTGQGDRALPIVGEYGSGKTYLLRWMGETLFEPSNIRHFAFDNPGVAFYDLANRLLRQVGRYELSKALWEVVSLRQTHTTQPRLVDFTFPEWLSSIRQPSAKADAIGQLRGQILGLELTTDEEIAHKVALMVAETGSRPYFEYRDFVAGKAGALVAEREEAPYFRTLIRILLLVNSADGIAFLIDEFEDVALQRRLTKKQSFEYLATLRRLLDVSAELPLWLVVSMTPEAFAQTTSLDPSLAERFAPEYRIPPLTQSEAYGMVRHRVGEARIQSREGIFPFEEGMIEELRLSTSSKARPLIKVLFQAVASASSRGMSPPIPTELVREAEETVYPVAK